jgi:hypothetical protein
VNPVNPVKTSCLGHGQTPVYRAYYRLLAANRTLAFNDNPGGKLQRGTPLKAD